MSINNISLGLCCINTRLRQLNPSIFPNRTCRLATAKREGVSYVEKLALQNLLDVCSLLRWNKDNGILAYRLSSDMFPHAGNPQFGTDRKEGPRYSLNFAIDYLQYIGEMAEQYNIRLSYHPGQYNQVASPSKDTFEKTILDLSHHARILDIIEEGRNLGENRAIICIHGGGVYGNKKKTMMRWIERFRLLPANVQSRIALENCEKCYSTEDCLELCETLNIPMIFDLHHYNCYTILHPEEKQPSPEELLSRIISTWQKRGLKPYFHVSEQGSGRIGHHSDYVEDLPDWLLNISTPITLDVEAKAKENAILRLVSKYSK